MSYLSANKKLSVITKRLVPEHIRTRHPDFVTFIEGFYKYLEKDGNPYSIITNLLFTADIDKVSEEYLHHYKNTYAESIPEHISNNFRFFIKNAQKIYRTRGTEVSHEFYFNHVFNDTVDFYYPSEDILKLSSAKWRINHYFTITEDIENDAQFADEVQLYVGSKIKGVTTGASAYISSVGNFETFPTSGVIIYAFEIYQRTIVGEFQDGETLEVIESSQTIPESYSQLTLNTQYVHPGYYEDQRHTASGRSKIRDNHYYQEFSYVLKSPVSASIFFPYIKEFVHPAGYLLFGEVIISSGDVSESGYGPNTSPYFHVTRPFIYPKFDPDPDHGLGELHAVYHHNRFISYKQDWVYPTFAEAEAKREVDTNGIMLRYIADWEEVQIGTFTDYASDELKLTASRMIP